MRSSICSSAIVLTLVMMVGFASALAPIGNLRVGCTKPSALSALQNAPGPLGSRGVPSKTARESAFNVDWEPMSELERRIEDGVNFEYIRPTTRHRQLELEDDIPSARGVFAGYRFSDDEYNRLKSADPIQ
jgi:hypothetical protein